MEFRSSCPLQSRGLPFAGCLPAIFLFALQLCGQTVSSSSESVPFARLLVKTQIGNDKQLGFKPPDLGIGFGIEKPVGAHVELQTFAEYSPDKKYITNDGNNFVWGMKGMWFPRWRAGISAELRQSYLWTSQFNKSGWIVAPGFLFRDAFGSAQGRFSVDYVIPRGCVWAAECQLPADGIQSNRTQGPEFAQEFRALSLGAKYTIRVGGELAFYHFCDQANPLVISPRSCHFADTIAMTVRLEFGGKDLWY
jgi:hypothetical protein